MNSKLHVALMFVVFNTTLCSLQNL